MALAVDASTPAPVVSASATILTTAAFTPPAGALLLAISTWDTSTTTRTATTTTVTGTTSAWTRVQMQVVAGGMACVDYAIATASSSTTFRTTFSGSSTDCTLVPQVVTGQHATVPIGSSGVIVATASTSITWTAAAAGSLVWAGYGSFQGGTVPSASAMTTVNSGTGSSTAGTYRQSTPAAAGSNSLTLTGCAVGAAFAWAEIAPAAVQGSGAFLPFF